MQRIKFLLVVIGGVLAAYSAKNMPSALVFLVVVLGGLLLGMSILFSSCVYGGEIWGIKIPYSKNGSIIKVLSFFGLIFGGYAAVTTIIGVAVSLASFSLVKIVIYLFCFILPLAIGPMIAKKISEVYLVAKSDNAMILEQIDLFKRIDNNIHNASSFVVGFEGIALFNSATYCYAVYRYEDFQLGELATPEQVALVGTYFVQKYHQNYTFKVDVEVIPGEPGQTVVAVGTGGIEIARIQGTPDTRLFRSYIFTRK